MKKMGRPTKETEAINVRLETRMVQKLDDARREQSDLPSRPEMIRRILQVWASDEDQS